MVIALFGPRIDVGPAAGLALWSVVLLAVLAALGAITIGGAIAFVLIGAVVVLVLYFVVQRVWLRLAGRR